MTNAKPTLPSCMPAEFAMARPSTKHFQSNPADSESQLILIKTSLSKQSANAILDLPFRLAGKFGLIRVFRLLSM